MTTLTHGSDLTLAPTLGPLVQAANTPPRQVLGQLRSQGFSSVQLDATLPGLRPRELDNSARRDLLATATRSGLAIAGIDFFIPAEHYHDAQHTDRAVQAAAAACALAGDLGRVPVSLNLPTAKADPAVRQALLDTAHAHGIALAIHDEPDIAGLTDWLNTAAAPHAGLGLDPAALLIRVEDPAATASTNAGLLHIARLSDASKGQADGGRQTLGAGSLSIMAYRVAIDLAPNRLGPVVLDLRGLANPIQAMQAAKPTWDQAAVQF